MQCNSQINLAFKAASAFFLSSCSYRSQLWHCIRLQAAMSSLLWMQGIDVQQSQYVQYELHGAAVSKGEDQLAKGNNVPCEYKLNMWRNTRALAKLISRCTHAVNYPSFTTPLPVHFIICFFWHLSLCMSLCHFIDTSLDMSFFYISSYISFRQLFGLPGLHPWGAALRFLGIATPELGKWLNNDKHMGVSKNNGAPKSSILIGFSIINHPFWGTPIFGNTHIGFKHLQTGLSTLPSHANANVACLPGKDQPKLPRTWDQFRSIQASSSSSHTKVLAANPMPTILQGEAESVKRNFLWISSVKKCPTNHLQGHQCIAIRLCHVLPLENLH